MPGGRAGASVVVQHRSTGGSVAWLFGGRGHGQSPGEGFLNDLWTLPLLQGPLLQEALETASVCWTWVSGSKTVGSPGSTTSPGAREQHAVWADAYNSGMFLFGGKGVGSNGV
eukprot:COSAG05_NODE_13753_length_419_cov_0.575000_1_plen_112_part_10